MLVYYHPACGTYYSQSVVQQYVVYDTRKYIIIIIIRNSLGHDKILKKYFIAYRNSSSFWSERRGTYILYFIRST